MAVLFCITYAVFIAFVFAPTQKTSFAVDGNASQITLESNRESHGRIPTRPPTQTAINIAYSSSKQLNQSPNNGETKKIHSVLVPQAFSYDVVQQPENEPFYVSTSRNLVTEFGLARKYNNIGLLAHNHLAGSLFKDLRLGQDIFIIYQDGHSEHYIVNAIYRFQALEPNKTGSQFVDLESGSNLTAPELFSEMYTGAPHLTLQTCIDAQGDPSWGRLFVIAVPAGGT